MQSIFNNIFLSNSFNYINSQIFNCLTPLQKKVAIIAMGCFSLMTLGYFASRCFCAKTNIEEMDIEDIEEMDIEDVEDIEEQREIANTSMGSFRSDASLKAEQEVQKLVEKKDFDNAWFKFVSFNNKSLIISSGLHSGWTFLPPVELIQHQIDKYAIADLILMKMPPEFIRDCLIAYPELHQQFFANGLFADLFNVYESYITDICIRHKKFAKNFILSSCSQVIHDDKDRMEIFRAAYLEIVDAFRNNEIDIQQMNYFSQFLLNYQSVIPQAAYDKIKKLEKAICQLKLTQGKNFDERLHTLIQLIISKLNEQGIFAKNGTYVDKNVAPLNNPSLLELSTSDQIKKFVDRVCK